MSMAITAASSRRPTRLDRSLAVVTQRLGSVEADGHPSARARVDAGYEAHARTPTALILPDARVGKSPMRGRSRYGAAGLARRRRC
jgi:hypothetical protein